MSEDHKLACPDQVGGLKLLIEMQISPEYTPEEQIRNPKQLHLKNNQAAVKESKHSFFQFTQKNQV
jgi:hypothetical protein